MTTMLLYYYPREHGLITEQAMAAGARAVGWQAKLRHAGHYEAIQREGGDLVGVWSMRGNRPAILADCAADGLPAIVVDLGAVKRADGYYQVGVNRLNWLPRIAPDDSRRAQLGLRLPRARRPDRGPYAPILLCGQLPDDAQHRLTAAELDTWAQLTIEQIRRHTERPILWRPHPLRPERVCANVDGVSDPRRQALGDAIACSHAVVTYNSSAAWEALQAGVPVFCEAIATFAPAANLRLADIETPQFDPPLVADLLRRLAYAHWSRDEIAAGAPLRFLCASGALTREVRLTCR